MIGRAARLIRRPLQPVLVLYSLDDSEGAYMDITEAMAHGEFSRSEYEANGTVIAGTPIIEAHYYEARLQWIGVMLAPSVLRKALRASLTEIAIRTEN